MNYTRFENNLISVIKEAQIKLGYDKMPISINYIKPTLKHLFGECDENDIVKYLTEFSNISKDKFGKIDIISIDNGYRITISAQGNEYVNILIKDNEFLVEFIKTIRSLDCTIDKVVDVFKKYSDNVVVKQVNNDDFDYLIYFENGDIDDFWYCIDTDDLGTTYHRFIKEDYLDFGF